MSKNLKEISKGIFTLSDESKPTIDQINTSCLMRIADAAELTAKNFSDIMSERDKYKKWWLEEQSKTQRLERKVSALKGVITRQKNKEDK